MFWSSLKLLRIFGINVRAKGNLFGTGKELAGKSISSGLERKTLLVFWTCSRTSIKQPPVKRPTSFQRPVARVPTIFFVTHCI